jgi:hypothetical protein
MIKIITIIQIITSHQLPFVPLYHRDQCTIKGLESCVRHDGEAEEEQNQTIPDNQALALIARLNSRRPSYKCHVLPVSSVEQFFGEKIAVQDLEALYPLVLKMSNDETVEKAKIKKRPSYLSDRRSSSEDHVFSATIFYQYRATE